METRHPSQEELTTTPSSSAELVRIPGLWTCRAWVCSRGLWHGFWNQTYMLMMARSLNPPVPQFPHL